MTVKKKNTCKRFEAKMDHYVCEILPEAGRLALEAHIDQCAACARTFSGIKASYSFIRTSAGEVPTTDWDTSWRIIRKRVLEKKDPGKRRLPGPGWGFVLAGSMLIFLVGIFVGKYVLFSPRPAAVTDSQINRQLQSALLEHIENIKPVIIQYANYTGNADHEQNLSMGIDREIASKFLVKNRLLQGRMERDKNLRMSQLLEELDMILTEISNLTAGEPENLFLIKELIKIKGTLLKMEILHSPRKEPMRT